MSTFFVIVGVILALVGTHAFAYWRGAVAGEERARQQAAELVAWAEAEGKELGAEAADALRKLYYRLRGRFHL